MKTAILFLTALSLAAPAISFAQASKPAAKAARPGSPRPVKTGNGPLLFHGYACGADCSLHQEGYAWGSAHRISNPLECRGNSESFIEGCKAFAGIEGPLGEREIFQDED